MLLFALAVVGYLQVAQKVHDEGTCRRTPVPAWARATLSACARTSADLVPARCAVLQRHLDLVGGSIFGVLSISQVALPALEDGFMLLRQRRWLLSRWEPERPDCVPGI
jgi:hypothetical protein